MATRPRSTFHLPLPPIALATFVVLTMLATPGVAQTFTVLHNFTGGADGNAPNAGVTIGPSGVLYGTAASGGNQICSNGCGTVFRLHQVNSSWVFSPLYEFSGGDGEMPLGGVVIGPNGALYGTTSGGGGGHGLVFELGPPATVCRSVLCSWNENVLHTFTGAGDGAIPFYENLVFDQAGNIYGTTYEGGGVNRYGTVFELTPSGGGYTESIIHAFGGFDGAYPQAGVILDSVGNVYGTTTYGGSEDLGTLYQVMPVGGGWNESVLVNFELNGGGYYPSSSIIIDESGNIYGTTEGEGGGIFKLAPSDGGWTYSEIYSFTSCEPQAGVSMDAAGNLFGACYGGGAYQDGWIFELTNCSQSCVLIDLHDFDGSDGASPLGTPTLDANGNLYGTTPFGGTPSCFNSNRGCGVVWEIAGVGAPHKN